MFGFKKRYLRLVLLAIPAMGIGTLFQNCGQTNFDTTIIETPARSPFFEKRVRIDDPKVMQQKYKLQKKATAYVQQLSVMVNNPCAVKACEIDSTSLVCGLQKTSMRKELENSLQAYRYNPEKALTTEQLEEMLSFNHADSKCVIGISDERAYQQSQVYNDPIAPNQYHHAVLASPAATEYLRTLPRPPALVYVGIVDSGVQNTHEDLSGVPISNSVYSSSCATICNFHGTAVAGVIASIVNNLKGGAGLFTGNILMYSAQVGNADGVITTSELVNGLTFLRNVNVEVINLSLGGFNTNDFSLQDAVERLAAKDVTLVVAAGNNGQNLDAGNYYPASFLVNGQINVGSASPRDIPMTGQAGAPSAAQITSPIELDSFSNYSPAQIHIAAPGKAIRTLGLNNGYTITSGTSFAAPMVTAAAIWVRSVAKANGLKITARQVKEIVLSSTVVQPSLDGKIQAQRYLNFAALKQNLQNLHEGSKTLPGQISLVSSEVIGSGPTAVVRVTVAINNANNSTGWTMRAYTNPDFLADTFTGQTCSITTDTTCTFDVSYSSMLVDPGIYLEIKTGTGALVSDHLIPKTSMNFGNRAAAPLLGAVINTTVRNRKVAIEGWACLKGFPDQLPIEVHLGSPSGTLLDTIQASRWARGDYFAQCDSAEVRLGFEYVVPETYINGVARNLFFVAKTADGSRSLDLPVYSYQPGYMDATLAQMTTSVYLDPYLADETPTVTFTNVSYRNYLLELTGNACFRNSRKPIALAFGVGSEDLLDLIPEMRMPLNTANLSPDGSTQATYALSSKSVKISYTNSAPRAVENAGMIFRYSPPFNDDTDEYGFYSPAPVGNSNRLLRSGSDTFSQFGLVTVSPSVAAGDGCAFPSGFTLSYDVRQMFHEVGANIGVLWRPDQIQNIDALLASRSVPQAFINLLNSSTVNRNITAMSWSPRALPISYAVVGTFSKVFDVSVTADSLVTYFNMPSIIAGWNTPIAASSTISPFSIKSADIGGSASGSSMVYDGWSLTAPSTAVFSGSATMGKNFPLTSRLWADVSPVTVNVVNAAAYSVIKTYPLITLPKTARDRLMVVLRYQNASATPVPRDLLLEFQINGTGPWYEAHMAKYQNASGSITNSTLTGNLLGDVNLPANAATLNVRLKAKGTQQFTVNRIGVLAE